MKKLNLGCGDKILPGYVNVDVVESRRGMGMFVNPGARGKLLAHERQRFMAEDWPRIVAQIKALELDPATLLKEFDK